MMAEHINKDNMEFRTFLDVTAQRMLPEIVKLDSIDGKIVAERNVVHALHFLNDIELYHTVCVDETLLQTEQGAPAEVIEPIEDIIEYADAINFTRTQIFNGNTHMIRALSSFEIKNNIRYGAVPFIGSPEFSGEKKWDDFIEFVAVEAPDYLPEKYAA